MSQNKFRKSSNKGQRMGEASQESRFNDRLAHALNHSPIRSRESYLVFEINTHNPKTGQRHKMQIRHEPENGNNRYNVYLDGDKWRNCWSRWRFANWMFSQINSVIRDWH